VVSHRHVSLLRLRWGLVPAGSGWGYIFKDRASLPAAWAIDGFQNIVLRGQGMASTFLPAGVLLAFAGAFFALAVWRFKFE